jgi:hypothetical protein
LGNGRSPGNLLQSIETRSGLTATANRIGDAPRVVTLHFGGSGWVDVSPYWLGEPDTYLGDS